MPLLLLLWLSIPMSFAGKNLVIHKLNFVLHPDLVQKLSPQELRYRLKQYVDDVNFVFAKTTRHRYSFDPETAIKISAASQPYSNSFSPVGPLRKDYPVMVHVRATQARSYGGSISFDTDGTDVVGNTFWNGIVDPRSVQPNSDGMENYSIQLGLILHELAHTLGAGISEYYSQATIEDTTGISPNASYGLDGDYKQDIYWSTRQDYLNDPLLVSSLWHSPIQPIRARRPLLERLKFSQLTSAVIDSERSGKAACVPASDCTADLSAILLNVIDSKGRPLAKQDVRVWAVRAAEPHEFRPIFSGATDAKGLLHFAWAGEFGNFDNLILVKVPAIEGQHQGGAAWYSIFDAHKQRLVQKQNTATISLSVKP